jgi:hypothetical protein
MTRRIPLEFDPALEIPIDGTLVARTLGLDVARFRRLMDERRITVLCERGTGEDAGLYRVSFSHEGRRARLVVVAPGRPVPRRGQAPRRDD